MANKEAFIQAIKKGYTFEEETYKNRSRHARW